MKTLGAESIATFLGKKWYDKGPTNDDIRLDSGYRVTSFRELVQCVAKLAFHTEHVLLFRGQNWDYRKGNHQTVLKPSIFRMGEARNYSRLGIEIPRHYKILGVADALLARKWREAGLDGLERIERHRILRWAILQHYEVCRTPLLDATHSLRVAASIACLKNKGPDALLYVLAVPQLSGSITASAEVGLQIVRLSSICPPSARRPHFQEGYLVAEYPELVTLADRRNYKLYEIDVARRVLAKFRFTIDGFWDDAAFPMLPKEALFPEANEGDDKVEEVMAEVLAEIKKLPNYRR